jgi:hypothetical protein
LIYKKDRIPELKKLFQQVFFPLLVFANFGIKIATTIRRRRLVF